MGCKLAVNVVHPAENFLKKFSPKRLNSKSLEGSKSGSTAMTDEESLQQNTESKTLEDTNMDEESPDSDIFPIDLHPPDKVL